MMPAPMPVGLSEPIPPMLAAAGHMPRGLGWAFEFKYDGVRAITTVHDGQVRTLSRNGNDVIASYPELAELATLLEHRSAVLDGEIVALHPGDRPSFARLQQRILQATGNNQFVSSCTAPVKAFLLEEGTDPKYGARHLKRAIEKNVVFPLANLVATGQIKLGDFIRIDRKENELTFTKEAEGALVPVLLEKYGELNSGSQLAAKAGRGGTTGKSPRDFGPSPLLDRGSGTK